MLRSAKLILSAICVLAVAVNASAADKKSAVTDINLVDQDFAFQGEYTGVALNDSNCWQCTGLQVIAMGDGKFDAVAYPGGLPGSGWYGGADKSKFQGERQGDTVTLASEGRRIIVKDGVAKFQTDGLSAGSLAKTHRVSSSDGAAPPAWATVLFDGTSTEHFKNGKITDDGLLMVGTQTAKAYRDFSLHLEFRLPYMPHARGQGRANSGVYLQSRYEVQILDSFGLEGAFNECGGLYRLKEPDVNMCFPPLSWQTYDIDVRSARFDDAGHKLSNMLLNVRHNGVVIHDNLEVERKTGAGSKEGSNVLPTKLQNHGNPVNFRNIWIVEYADAPAACQPVARSRRRGLLPQPNLGLLGQLFAPLGLGNRR